MIDAVLSYHMNPATCGVAKFNHALAKRLGVPCYPIGVWTTYPILSVNPDELPFQWPSYRPSSKWYDVFLHGLFKSPADADVIRGATRVFAANAVLANRLRDMRPDIIEAFCPSTLQGNPHRAELNVLTFGMAHKLQLPYYEKLKTLLDGCGQDYTVSVSTAVHEGSPWSAVSDGGENMRAIFGAQARVLGYLADDALAKELRDCSAVAMFFDPALRANNTTFWAAHAARKTVITNLDGDSPIPHSFTSLYDVMAMTEWPQEPYWAIRNPKIAEGPYTWDHLLQTMGVSVNV